MDKWQVDFNGMTYYLPVRGNIILLYIYIYVLSIYIYFMVVSNVCVFLNPETWGFMIQFFSEQFSNGWCFSSTSPGFIIFTKHF